jgi:PIN domain nuclease of toxin-antitoxin system
LLAEPGAERVASVLQQALLSTVNLAEVHTRLLRLGEPSNLAWDRIAELPCEVCPFSRQQSRIAAELVAVTRPLGLSLGDRACLALAIERSARAYTTDREWRKLSLSTEIELIR